MRLVVIRGCAAIAAVIAVTTGAGAQVRQQIFAGAGFVVPRQDDSASTAVNVGYALILPLNREWSLRPLVGVSRVDPTAAGRESFPTVLAGALVIRRVTATFSLLAGGGVNALFPPQRPGQRQTVAIVSTNNRINGRWVLLTPVVISDATIGLSTQFAFAW